jgi:hypothetical protein
MALTGVRPGQEHAKLFQLVGPAEDFPQLLRSCLGESPPPNSYFIAR